MLYSFGGRAVLSRIRRTARGDRVERVLGVVLIVTGIAIAFNLDTRFENILAPASGKGPGFLVDPTRALESSSAISRELASLRARLEVRRAPGCARTSGAASGVPHGQAASLPKLGRARPSPTTRTGSTPRVSAPLTLAGLRGHVVLVDFWTYTCINCIRTLPFVEGLYKQLPPLRAGCGGRGDARVHVRAQRRQTSPGDPIRRHHLPGGPGQQLRHLERLPATSTGPPST